MKVRILTCLLLALSAGATLMGAETREQWEIDLLAEKRGRIAQWIRELDASPPRRKRPAQALLEAYRRDDADLVLMELEHALDLDNEQIREGAGEVLGLIGDPRSIPVLARQLRYDAYIVVRQRILHQLPCFLVSDQRTREEVRDNLTAETYAVTDRIRSILREGGVGTPLQSFSPRSQARRDEIRHAIASQLDPVEAAIAGLESRRDSLRAQRVLVHFFGKPLGETSDEWYDAWAQLSKRPQTYRVFEELRGIEGLQVSACRLLQDMGAEGTEYVCARLERLVALDRPDTRETALSTTVELARLARHSLRPHHERVAALKNSPSREAELVWHRRRIESAERIQALASQLGRERLMEELERFRAVAYRAVGAGVPPVLPGDSEALRAEKTRLAEEAVARLHEQRVAKIDHETGLTAMAQACSWIGTSAAVRELAGLASFRSYTASRTDQITEYRVVRAAIDALAHVAADPALPGARAAFEELLLLRDNDTMLAGGPSRGGDEGLSVSDIVRYHLRVITRSQTSRKTDADWRAAYEASVFPADSSDTGFFPQDP